LVPVTGGIFAVMHNPLDDVGWATKPETMPDSERLIETIRGAVIGEDVIHVRLVLGA
jgi:hypothetical protein